MNKKNPDNLELSNIAEDQRSLKVKNFLTSSLTMVTINNYRWKGLYKYPWWPLIEKKKLKSIDYRLEYISPIAVISYRGHLGFRH